MLHPHGSLLLPPHSLVHSLTSHQLCCTDCAGASVVISVQFSMWATIHAPLLLSQTIVNMSAHRLETYSNTEVRQFSNIWSTPTRW